MNIQVAARPEPFDDDCVARPTPLSSSPPPPPKTHPLPGVAKQYAYWILINYREAYDMFLVNGILFNHEVRASVGYWVGMDRLVGAHMCMYVACEIWYGPLHPFHSIN